MSPWHSLSLLASDAYASLTAKPMRTVALMFGILLGVATVVSAVTLADTQQVKVDRAFDQQRARTVVIAGQDVPETGFSAENRTQINQLAVASGAGEVSIWRDNVAIAPAGESAAMTVVPVVAADAPGLQVVGARTRDGAAFTDAPDGAPDAVWLGATAATRLGVDVVGSHNRIDLDGHPYRVVGIIEAPSGYAYINSSVVMTRSAAYRAFDRGENVRFLISVRPGSAAAVAAFALSALDPGQLMLLRNATPPDSARLPKQVGDQLRTLGIGLGVFVGIVGLIGVANTLAMTVAYRIRELGLRSALGWSRRRLAGLVLVESLLAGALASVIGAAVGLGALALWCEVQGLQLIIHPAWVLTAVAGGVIAGALGGIFPALQASSISPMEALRS